MCGNGSTLSSNQITSRGFYNKRGALVKVYLSKDVWYRSQSRNLSDAAFNLTRYRDRSSKMLHWSPTTFYLFLLSFNTGFMLRLYYVNIIISAFNAFVSYLDRESVCYKFNQKVLANAKFAHAACLYTTRQPTLNFKKKCVHNLLSILLLAYDYRF